MKMPTGIKLCISHKIATSLKDHPLKVTVLLKAIIRITYKKLIITLGHIETKRATEKERQTDRDTKTET